MSSILTDTKALLGIEEEYTHFDKQIVAHINSALFVLNQLGVGPDKPFVIEDKSSEWSDFVGEGEYELVQTYVYRSVRRVFDPPTNSSHLNALKEDMKEDEWRLNVQAESED